MAKTTKHFGEKQKKNERERKFNLIKYKEFHRSHHPLILSIAILFDYLKMFILV